MEDTGARLEGNFQNAEPSAPANGVPPPLSRIVTLLEDHRQKRLFPTTIGGDATVKSSDK
jgi:hypothetical protein